MNSKVSYRKHTYRVNVLNFGILSTFSTWSTKKVHFLANNYQKTYLLISTHIFTKYLSLKTNKKTNCYWTVNYFANISQNFRNAGFSVTLHEFRIFFVEFRSPKNIINFICDIKITKKLNCTMDWFWTNKIVNGVHT